MSKYFRARRYARTRRAVVGGLVIVALLGPPTTGHTEEAAPAARPATTHLQVPSVDASVPPHPGMLPIGRGHQQDGYLDPQGLVPPLPTGDLFEKLRLADVVPSVPVSLPRLDVGGLVDGLAGSLPKLDTAGLRGQVTQLVDQLTGEALALVDSVEGTARALAVAATEAAAATPSSSSTAADDPTPQDVVDSLTFNLTTTASGVTQTFTLPLCTPTPVNITSTLPAPPTTIVSLCPVPLGVTGSPVTPPAGQPLQLYLSVNRIAGTAVVPATFLAGYTVKDPTTATQFTVRFGLVSTSQAYPESAIVGAATDYNPVKTPEQVPPGYIPPQTVINATMSWSTSGPTDSIRVEADGVGSVALNALPQNNGTFAITVENDKPTFHFLSGAPLPSGTSSSIVLTRPLTTTVDKVTTGVLTWSKLPQEFLFHLNATQKEGEPITLSFNGSQNMQPNPGFSVSFDYTTNGQLAGRLTQAGFGAQLATSVTLNRDAGDNVTGVLVNSTPGALSTAVMSAYRNGSLSAVVELGAMPADTSETTIQLKGTVTDASAGITISGTNAPPFIGAASYMVGSTPSPTAQASMILTRGATPPGLPFPIAEGAVLSLRVTEVARNFKIEVQAKGSGGVVTGVDTSGSTTSSARTANQLVLRAKLDASRRIVLLMNQLGDTWTFNGEVQGPSGSPTGMHITDTNPTPVPNEYKQIALFTNGTVSHSLVVQRPASDLSGAIPPAGIQGTVYDPPSSFDVTIDYVAPQVANAVCSQALKLSGVNSASSNGWVKLTNGAVTVDVERLFVQGDWRVDVTASGGASCDPTSFKFDMRQGIGANPAGRVTATATGAGQVVIKSFSTTQTVTVDLLPGSDGKPAGAKVTGTNSEANPGQQIQLLHYKNNVVESAFNIWAGNAGPITYGNITGILTNTPQNFGIEFQKVTDAVTKGEAARVVSHNQSAAPAETLYLFAPAGDALPGGKLRLTLRSLDVATMVQIGVAKSGDGTLHAHLVSQNANPNLTEVVNAGLLDAGGTPIYNILLYRPNGDLSGIPTGATKATAVWERMPQSFDMTVKLVSNPNSGADFTMDLKNSQENGNGVLRLVQPEDNMSLTFGGTGASQNFKVSYATVSAVSLHVSGNAPAGMGFVQISRLRGSTEDMLLTVYRGGSLPVWSTDRGTEVWVQPPATMAEYNATIRAQGRTASFTGGGDVRGNRVVVAQYYQLDNKAPCVWSGWNYPCTDIQLSDMPAEADLTMALGDKEHPAPTLNYSATDSGLNLRVNALVPQLGGYMTFSGLPKAGVTFTATVLPNSGGLTATIAAKDPADPLPYFYVYGWNIKLPLHIDAPVTKSLGWGATFNALMSIHFNYNAYLTIQGDAGLTRVVVTSPTVGDGKDARWAGLLGIKASGNPNSRFNLGVSMDLDPGSHGVSWDWEITEGNLFLIDQDSDWFTWYNPYSTPLGFSDVGLSSYAWEARPNDSRRYAGYGCSNLSTTPPVVNDDDKLGAGTPIPFSPSFVRVNSGVVVCGEHVAYYQVNINDLLFKHNGFWGPGCCGDSWSYAHIPLLNDDTDWLLAVALKNIYTHDPDNLTAAT